MNMDDQYEWQVTIEGRIAALEMIMTPIMLDWFSRVPSGDMRAAVEAERKVMFASLQQYQRPIGEHSDRVWEAAVEALERLFGNARMRIEAILGDQ